MTERTVAAIAAIIGTSVGLFWLFAVDASVNGATWPPHWRHWPAYVTCPFIPLIGMNSLANVSVPVLNALTYGTVIRLAFWCKAKASYRS